MPQFLACTNYLKMNNDQESIFTIDKSIGRSPYVEGTKTLANNTFYMHQNVTEQKYKGFNFRGQPEIKYGAM